MVIVLKCESPDHKNYIPLLGDTDKKGRRNGENSPNSNLSQDTLNALAPRQRNLKENIHPHFLEEEGVDTANRLVPIFNYHGHF